jgi:hypothetical protein
MPQDTQTRIIVREGVLKLTAAERNSFMISVATQLLRSPDNRYINTKTPTEKGFYGYAQGMVGFHVAWTVPIEYEQQIIWAYENWGSQQRLWQYCFEKRVASALQQMSTGSGVGTIEFYPLDEAETYKLEIDRIRFKVWSNATLQVNVAIEPFEDECGAMPEGKDKPQEKEREREPEEPTPDPFNPGYDTPSPPYEPPDDNGETDTGSVPPNATAKLFAFLKGEYHSNEGWKVQNDVSESLTGTNILFEVPNRNQTLDLLYTTTAPNVSEPIGVYRVLPVGVQVAGGWKATPTIGYKVIYFYQ